MSSTVPYLQFIIDQSKEARTLSSCLLAFVVLSVAIRMYVRIRMLKQFGSEDWSMILAFVLCSTQLVLSIYTCSASIKAIAGDHRALKLTSELPQLCTAFYALAMLALKISLGFFFFKIFSHRRVQRYIIVILCICSTITGIAYFALSGFTCVSLKRAPSNLTTCKLQPYGTGVFYAFSVVSVASDFIFAAMAIAALIAAKLPLTTKIPACALLALGTVSGVASIIRFVLIVQPSTSASYVGDLFAVGKWTTVEHAIAVITANLAMTRPLLHAFVMRVRGGISSINGSRRGGTSSTTMDNANMIKKSPASTPSAKSPPAYMKHGKADSVHGLELVGISIDDTRGQSTGDVHLLVDVKREVTVVVEEDDGDKNGQHHGCASDVESAGGNSKGSSHTCSTTPDARSFDLESGRGNPYRGHGRDTFEDTYLPGRSRY